MLVYVCGYVCMHYVLLFVDVHVHVHVCMQAHVSVDAVERVVCQLTRYGYENLCGCVWVCVGVFVCICMYVCMWM